MGAVVLGSSVVLALFDAQDVHHASAVDAVRPVALGDRVVSVVTLAEVLVDATRTGQVEHHRARVVRAFGLADVDERTAVRAASLRAEHPGLRLPDALILATAAVLDADLLTADRRWAAVSPRVRVIG